MTTRKAIPYEKLDLIESSMPFLKTRKKDVLDNQINKSNSFHKRCFNPITVFIKPLISVLNTNHNETALFYNPIKGTLHIKVHKKADNIIYSLYCSGGKVIASSQILDYNTSIYFENYAANIYLLIVSQNGNEIGSYKIVKQIK